MGSIGRYIFRTTIGAFLVICASVTALMWITQALRDIDLMTNQGQSILVFIGITGLIIPLLILICADRVDDRGRACAQQARQRFRAHRDERGRHAALGSVPAVPGSRGRRLVAGRRHQHLRLAVGPARVAPLGNRGPRRSRFNIVQPGRFSKLEERLTLHIRERRPNGQLLGIFIDDQRNPKERATILAEHGDIVKNERGLFLVLENGSVQRHETGQRDPTVVLFNSYGFDLSCSRTAPRA